MIKKNLLVSLADDNYIEEAKQLFSSAYWNGGWNGDYMLLAHEIPDEKLKWFREKGIFVKKCRAFHNKPIEGWPVTVLSKLYLFTPYFKKWKNIVYLDADITVRASLEELTKVNGFAAAGGWGHLSKLFMTLHYLKIKKINLNLFSELKRDYILESASFKSGLMALNTDVIKKDTFPKLRKLFNSYNEIIYGDEAILNLYFYRKWTRLPNVYNVDVRYSPANLEKIKSKKIQGITLHLGKVYSKNYFYEEWKNSLRRAELIDLKRISLPSKKFTEDEIRYNQKLLEQRTFSMKNLVSSAEFSADRLLGLCGLFLKYNHPKLYLQLKAFWKK